MRHGLFGGTFDPPHVGHLMMAEVARESLGLDVVEFIPANIPPHKQDLFVQPAEFRVRLLQTAVQSFPDFRVETIEVKREGPSYTIDTVRAMVQEAPSDEWFFLLGADMLQNLPQWHQARELMTLVTFIVAPRPGIDLPNTIQELQRFEPVIQIVPLAMPELDISSTWLRERLQLGLRIDPLLPAGVASLIEKEGRYRVGHTS